jgi:ABC-type transport system involved in multi-copper enzyme maturation permease subunit
MSNDLVKGILKILPSNCYSSFIRATPASDTMLSTSQGGIVLLVWVVATLTAGYVLFNKRDA